MSELRKMIKDGKTRSVKKANGTISGGVPFLLGSTKYKQYMAELEDLEAQVAQEKASMSTDERIDTAAQGNQSGTTDAADNPSDAKEAKRARPEDVGQALEQTLSELDAQAVLDEAEAASLTQKLSSLREKMARDKEQMQKIQEAIVKFKLERQTRRKAPRLEQQPSSVVFEGYSPYAHKKGVNDVLMHNFSETMRIYRPDDFEWEEASAFCLDGPDVMTTRAINRLGVRRVQVVNDNRHGDFPAIQQAVVDQKIQADVFQGTVCDFLAEAKDAAYSFILHDGHGWKGRAEEIDALLNRIAPVCLFAVSVQIKGCGVHCSHGPVQNVKVKKEQPASDDEEGDVGAVITDVKEHTEIQQFTNMITDKMALRDIKIRRTYPAYDALGRDPRTMFRVLMWVLDAREYKNIKA